LSGLKSALKVRMARIVLASIITLILFLATSCSQKSSLFHAKDAQVTDPHIGPKNPIIINIDPLTPGTSTPQTPATNTEPTTKPQQGKQITLGFLEASDWNIEKTEQTLSVSVIVAFKQSDSLKLWSKKVALSGTVTTDGRAYLYPENDENDGTPPIRARAVCSGFQQQSDCDHIIFDLFAKTPEKIFATQHEIHLKKAQPATTDTSTTLTKEPEPATPAEPATAPKPTIKKNIFRPTPSKVISSEGSDPDEKPSVFIGTLHEDPDELFEQKKPAETRPLPAETEKRPRDQVIGLPNSGLLSLSTDLRDFSKDTNSMVIIRPERERSWGSWELIQLIKNMGDYAIKNLDNLSIKIGDLSQKSGGKLRPSRHVSHQNGTDVDIAYPLTKKKSLGFYPLVSKGQVSADLNVADTWELLQFAFKSTLVDRIFVDQSIKNLLCAHVKKTNAYNDEAQESLRRIRHSPGHHTHFHLRIRCTKEQPRCRTLSAPPAGSGCN
jgi:murein endopeptidase